MSHTTIDQLQMGENILQLSPSNFYVLRNLPQEIQNITNYIELFLNLDKLFKFIHTHTHIYTLVR